MNVNGKLAFLLIYFYILIGGKFVYGLLEKKGLLPGSQVKEYVNSDDGVRFTYKNNWQETRQDDKVGMKFQVSGGKGTFYYYESGLSEQDTLDSFSIRQLKEIKKGKGVKIGEYRSVIINNTPYRWLKYSYAAGKKEVVVIQNWAVANNRVYLFGTMMDKILEKEMYPEALKIIASIEILKLNVR